MAASLAGQSSLKRMAQPGDSAIGKPLRQKAAMTGVFFIQNRSPAGACSPRPAKDLTIDITFAFTPV